MMDINEEIAHYLKKKKQGDRFFMLDTNQSLCKKRGQVLYA